MGLFNDVMLFFSGMGWAIGVIALIMLVVFHKTILRIIGVVLISNKEVGIVNKKWVLFGSNKKLPDGKIIALNGEAGIQADTLCPGIHFGYWPWQYNIINTPLVVIERDCVGIVEAFDGTPLSESNRVLGKKINCDSFQDAKAFLSGGGERGPQSMIITSGAYRINTALFKITMAKVTDIPENMVGIVTTKEGKPLSTGEIAGKEIPGHNMYQDVDSFLKNGGSKGLQEQIILAGRYFINPLFATVELKEMQTVPIANVGVVISYVGAEGIDVTGENFKHGNLVKRGQKGVWVDPLDPGKYAINPYTHKVEIVPTANVVLNWATGKTESHMLDKNLSTITVRSSDGFTFNLDVSQIIHIPRNDAPKVIARFGTVPNLVTQVLEPTIGNYFRNAAQTSDVIEFLNNRSQRQNEAKEAIKQALSAYDVNTIDTLIGDINPPEALMQTLTERKLAEQERITFGTQKLAEDTRKELQQSKAMADTQAKVVDAERKVTIAEFDAQSSIAKSEGEAKSRTIMAEADATVLKLTGDAEAVKIQAIGSAEANVIKQKIESMDSNNYALVQVANALASNNIKLVPEILVNGSNNGNGGGIVDVLLANLVKENLNNSLKQDYPKQDSKSESQGMGNSEMENSFEPDENTSEPPEENSRQLNKKKMSRYSK